MLTRLYVNHYKSLVNFELKIPRLGLLLGPNGGGKTSVGEVLSRLALTVIGGADVAETFPTDTRTRWVTSKLQTFELELDDGTPGNQPYLYRLELQHDTPRRAVRIQTEEVTQGGVTLYRFHDGTVELYGDTPSSAPRARLGFDPHRSFLSALDPRKDNTRLVGFRSLVRNILVVKPDPPRMSARSEREERCLKSDGSNFASWYRWVIGSQPEVQEALTASLRQLLPGFTHLRFVEFGSEVRELKAEFKLSGKSYQFSLEELSDGQRMLVLLYALLHLLGRDEVMFLDEPDNFIALREVRPWMSQLEDRLHEVGGQVLIVSHGPEAIDYLASREAWLLTRPNGEATRLQPLGDQLGPGLKASEWLALGGTEPSTPPQP